MKRLKLVSFALVLIICSVTLVACGGSDKSNIPNGTYKATGITINIGGGANQEDSKFFPIDKFVNIAGGVENEEMLEFIASEKVIGNEISQVDNRLYSIVAQAHDLATLSLIISNDRISCKNDNWRDTFNSSRFNGHSNPSYTSYMFKDLKFKKFSSGEILVYDNEKITEMTASDLIKFPHSDSLMFWENFVLDGMIVSNFGSTNPFMPLFWVRFVVEYEKTN